MSTDSLFREAAARKNKFSASEMAEALGMPKEDVVRELRGLSALGAAESNDGVWRLSMRRTQARDAAVLNTIKRIGQATRTELNEALVGNTSAQVYTSLQRLIHQGRVQQSRDGSRTPRYVVTQ